MGSVTILFPTHVEHDTFITVLFTYFFSSLFQEHVLSLDYSFLLQHAVYIFISYMCFTGLLPCLQHEALLYIRKLISVVYFSLTRNLLGYPLNIGSLS